jgi:hypothetical protein
MFYVAVSREEIDWAGLRAAAVAVGIRPAARQAARDLPPDEQERFIQRAMKRCSRQKWLVKSQQDKADAVVTSPSALSANVRKGADVLSELLADNSKRSKIGFSKASVKAAEHFAELPAKELADKDTAQAMKHHVSSAAITHDWENAKDNVAAQSIVNVNVLALTD